MKFLVSVVLGIFLISLVSASCDLNVELVNQDPYPAVPGEYVKVVFQLQGAAHPDCGTVRFRVEDSYPFSLDSGQQAEYVFNAGGSAADPILRNFNQFNLIPYKLRIDNNALDGDTPLTVYYSYREEGSGGAYVEDFNISIEDTRTSFEVHVKDYSPSTKEITFEILNTGEEDIEALTIEIPEQEGVSVYGSSRVILGSLDSNEEDSAKLSGDFTADKIKLKLIYTDQINERRTVELVVPFTSSNFKETKESKGVSAFWAFVIGLAIPLIWIWWKKRRHKKKESKKKPTTKFY